MALACAVLVFIPALPTPGLASEFFGKVIPPISKKANSSRIEGLRWVSKKVKVIAIPFGFATQIMGILEGELPGGDRAIVFSSSGIPINESGQFSISVPLTSKITEFSIHTVDPFGRVETQYFAIETDRWQEVVLSARKLSKRGNIQVSGGTGISSLTYEQTNIQNYSELAITAKASAQYRIADRWDIMLSGYITALPISSSRNDVSARFLGLNLRAGYILPFVQSPWRLSILAGGYLATMFVTQDRFGYRNVMGPQIYPSIQRALSTGNIISAYFKYSPVSQSGTVLDFKSREVAVGCSWITPLDNHQLSFNFDISQLQLYHAISSARSQSFTVGIGYGW